MSSLGKIILKTLQGFYPYSNINITTEDIDGILERANINKNNSNKNDISKIIKILKHHIEIGQENKVEKVTPKKYTPVFSDLDKDNNFLDKMKLDYLDNFNKLKEQDLNFKPPQSDILPPALRVKDMMEEKEMEFEHYILIDSKDRNHDSDIDPSSYTIKLGISDEDVSGSINRNFEEVASIELIDVMIKHTQGSHYLGATDSTSIPPYLLLEIEEVGSNMEGTNESINKAFCRLTYFELIGTEGSDKNSNTLYRHYIVPRGNSIKHFKPRKNLTRLSIKIKNFNGSLYDFGNVVDDTSNSVNSFTFCIKTLQKNFVSNFIDKT